MVRRLASAGFERFLTAELDEVLARPAPDEPEQRALELFRVVAATVPAYRAFLTEHDIDPAAVRTVADFRTLPLLTKDNYLRRHPLAALCRDGDLTGCDMIAVSSGSTGEPTFWPRSVADEFAVAIRFEQVFHDSFAVGQRTTLAVVCFALGTWVGGMYTASCCRHLAAKGYPLTVITPGSNVEEILRVVTALGATVRAGCAARVPAVPQGRRRYRPGPQGAVAGLPRQAGAGRGGVQRGVAHADG